MEHVEATYLSLSSLVYTLKLFTVAIVTTLLTYYFQFRWRNRALYKFGEQFPGPKKLPFIGNINYFFGNYEEMSKRVLNFVLQYQFLPLYRLWFGPKLVIYFNQPEHIEKIMNSRKALDKNFFYKPLEIFLGKGLLTAPEHIWRVHRKTINPAFNQKILDTFADVFKKYADELVENLRPLIGKGHFNINPYIGQCTLKAICETSLGHNANEADLSKYLEAMQKLLEFGAEIILNYPLYPEWLLLKTKFGKMAIKYMDLVYKYTDAIIKKNREKFVKQPRIEASDTETEWKVGTQRKAFAQLLFENSDFTDAEIRDEVNIMIMAGNDTTALTDSFLLLMLAMHPEMQEKVYQEIYEVYGNSNRPMELDDLTRFPYLEKAMKETMRLFPVGPILYREFHEDVELAGYTIPKGVSAAIPTYAIHRNPRYWSDPNSFNPDRFSQPPEPFTYFPFSAGPRNCIGQKYAQMAIKYHVVTVLRHYRLTTHLKMEDLQLQYKLTMGVKPGYLVEIHPRVN